jgi:hypothetical protein
MSENPLDPEELLEQRGFLTPNQFCTLLQKDRYRLVRVSYPTLRRYIVQGYFVPLRVGGQDRLSRRDILHYLKNGTTGMPLPPEEGVKDPQSNSTQTQEAHTDD